MNGINHKTDDNDSLREHLLGVPPVAVPVTLDDDVIRVVPVPVSANDDVESPIIAQPLEVIDDGDWDHGEVQPKAFRDCFWAILFLLQFAAVATIAVMGITNGVKHSSKWLPSDDGNTDDSTGGGDENENRHIIWFLIALLATVVAVPSALLNLLLGVFSSMLIQISLVISPVSFLVTAVVSFVTMNCPVALFSFVMCVMGVYYAVRVWHQIPFATANLQIALAAIKDNHGLWIVSYFVTFKSYVWIFLWSGALLEMLVFSPGWVYNGNYDDDGNSTDGEDVNNKLSTQGKFILLGMLLSLFWTCQVITNIFHTTIAGVVGTWWFDPAEARSSAASGNGGWCVCCGCSSAIYDSWVRSGVHSLGSIAFGSLLVGILKVLQFFVRGGRRQRDAQRRMRGIEGTDFVFCLLQFFVDHLERLVEYINVWAYVYVGLYGYDYWTAGKSVKELFKARGWDVIINDNLVDRSLSMMSLLISLITGLIGMLLGFLLLGLSGAIQAFVLGFVLGGSSCRILFGVVTSAVNTVVVCFAESPNQLKENGHDPEHFRSLVEAYRKAYPNDCGF